MIRRRAALQAGVFVVAFSAAISAQRANAPIDLTGYWVSVVTEDWRWRMLTPPKGDASGVPLNLEGRKAADAWDPARDAASGDTCRAYGAAGIMREPTRMHITWRDEQTLSVELDAGAQTRLFRFNPQEHARTKATRQGNSDATWQQRALKVVTTNMIAGYLRKNGVPYSAEATLTEYLDLMPVQPNGDRWLVVSSIVDDPRYLTEPFVTSTHFKREDDGGRWHPAPCATPRKLDR